MNIDLLFFESSFEKKEDYISDEQIFEEYISTHSFEGNSNSYCLCLLQCHQITTKRF